MSDCFDQSVRSDDGVDVQPVTFENLLRRNPGASALVEVQDRRAVMVVNLSTERQQVFDSSGGYSPLLHPDPGVLG
jgi:hypothetical protein